MLVVGRKFIMGVNLTDLLLITLFTVTLRVFDAAYEVLCLTLAGARSLALLLLFYLSSFVVCISNNITKDVHSQYNIQINLCL